MNTNHQYTNLKHSENVPNNEINPVSQIFYHNFVLNKKNLDGKLLFQHFKIQSTSTTYTKFQNQRKKYYSDRRNQSTSFASPLSQQKYSKNRSGSSQGDRQKSTDYKSAFKHIKTSHDTFLFKKSIDLREKYLILQNPQNLQKLLKQRNLQSRRGLINISFQKQECLSKQKPQSQNSTQCKVQRCNLLSKYLHDTSLIRKKPELDIKKSKSKNKKSLQPKYMWKKTLEQFMPKLNIYQHKNLHENHPNKVKTQSNQQMVNFPECNAKNYAVIVNDFIICHKNGYQKKQIASLTKIMTCITALYLAEKFQIVLQTTQIKVPREAILLGGTTANLKFGDALSLKDLLFGMMLPSGNDASYAISQYFGRLIYRQSSQYSQKIQDMLKNQQFLKTHTNDISLISNMTDKKLNESKKFSFIPSIQAIKYFVQEMNVMAQYLQMTKSSFVNCHGLSDWKNRSTACDMAKLAIHSMKKNQKFKNIVRTKHYDAKIFNKNTKMMRVQKWINSNLGLFEEQYTCSGIKTGNTPSAGPCLASYYKNKENQITIILLNCQSKQDRFKEALYIYNSLMKSNNLNTFKRRTQQIYKPKEHQRSKTHLSDIEKQDLQQ